MQLSILIAAYNEQRSLPTLLENLASVGLEDYEVVIVDDGSTDQTAAIASDWVGRMPYWRLIRLESNQGKTAAIARAIQEARGEVILFQDADLEYDPHEIPDVIAPIQRNVADVVYGSRFLVKRAARVLYFYHYVANKCLTLLSNILTNRNMSDIETCYKAFRADIVRLMPITSRGFGLEVEITAKICRTKARTYEVPISYYGRTYEEGKKIGIRDGFAAIGYILYFNLIYPWSDSCTKYVEAVNERLSKCEPGVSVRRSEDR